MVTRANFGSCERRVVRKWRVDDKYGKGRCFWRYVESERESVCRHALMMTTWNY